MPEDINVHVNHRARMRQRYAEKGITAFAEHEVLEMLLYYCYPRQDTNEIAHRMIQAFGSLHNLMDADVTEIVTRCKVSEKTAFLVNLIPSLARRYMNSKWDDKMVVNDARSACEILFPLFVDATVEYFYMLCLDKQHRVNYVALIAEGTIDQTSVFPREVMSAVLRHQAAAVVLSHNHPGGSIKPSSADLEMTRRLQEGLGFIEVKVLDHIIVAGRKYYSMASRGQYVAGY